ncbi:MAG: hypothetical protein RIG62_04385 [Cyclobacteriaceae bacterium]
MKEEVPTDTPKKAWFQQLPLRIEKKFWNSEKIISLSAFVVSIATLLALLYQIRLSGEQNELSRQQQYASVLPYVQVFTETRDPGHFSVSLVNNGIGPAFIDEIRVVYDEQVYPGDLYSFNWEVIAKRDTLYFTYSNITEGRVIPAGETIIMAEVEGEPAMRDKLMYWFAYGSSGARAKIEVIYSSVYDEQWITSGIVAIPKLLSSDPDN